MKILITGGTGFIGSRVLQRLIAQNQHKIHLVTRVTTPREKYENFLSKGVYLHKIDINKSEISKIFKEEKFDWVFHLAAIRGAGKGQKEKYISSNVDYSLFLGEEVLKQGGKFIFCSSIGVFGTIPKELPPTEKTPKAADNLYYLSKIIAEEKLYELKNRGLNFVILRPTVTYGAGDSGGFPHLLVKYVDKGIFPVCKNTKIHLVDVDYVAEAFVRSAEVELERGSAYNIVDKEPVKIEDLVNFISRQLKEKPYPKWKFVPKFFFSSGKMLAQILRNGRLRGRFEFFSEDWYYDSSVIEKALGITPKETIPTFEKVINWYKSLEE